MRKTVLAVLVPEGGDAEADDSQFFHTVPSKKISTK
jgi:hypothetical protein